MKGLYFLAVLYAVVCTVWSEAEWQGYDLKETNNCDNFIDDLADDSKAMLLSTEGLERWCRKAIPAMQCMENYLETCMKKEVTDFIHTSLIKMKQAYKILCDPGPHQEVWSEAESQSCVIKEMLKCLDYLKGLPDEDETFFLSTEGLDRWCRGMNRGLQCLESYVQRCTNEKYRYHIYSKIIRAKQSMKNWCEPGPLQEEFLLHSPCLSQLSDDYVNFLHQYVMRFAEFLTKLKDPYSRLSNEIYSGTDSAMRIACCILRYFVVGIQRLTMENCGEETAKYIEDVLIQIFDDPTIQGGCSSYLHGPDQCQGAFDNWNF